MKLTKQRLGLVLVLGAGACALVADRLFLRSEGGLEAAAASVLTPGSATPAKAEKASGDAIDRSSASIADRLEKLSGSVVSGRNAFDVPWAVKPAAAVAAPEASKVDEPAKPAAPWKLTRVNDVDGRVAVVLDRTTVLKLGGEASHGLELVSASAKGGKPWAVVRETATGTEYRLELDKSEGTDKR